MGKAKQRAKDYLESKKELLQTKSFKGAVGGIVVGALFVAFGDKATGCAMILVALQSLFLRDGMMNGGKK